MSGIRASIGWPLAAIASAALLVGCASQPPSATSQAGLLRAPIPFIQSSGLVIGTLGYQYAGTPAAPPAQGWIVTFERLDAAAVAPDFLLVVEMDRETQTGVFSGALPEGLYSLRGATAGGTQYGPVAFRLPFEVQAGAVRDAGHHVVAPVSVQARRAVLR